MFAADMGRCWGERFGVCGRPLGKHASRAFIPAAAVVWPEKRGSCLPRLKDRVLTRLLSVL